VIRVQARPVRITAPLVASAALHVLLAAALIYAGRPTAQLNLPPMYKVELIAAPAGPPAIGAVGAEETAPAAKSVPKKAPDAIPIKKASAKDAKKGASTPVPKAKAGPAGKAGGGAVGGTGADVANIRTEGIEFPFPGYLQNIVRQVRVNFAPSDRTMRTAEVFFFIRRDGSMAGFRFLQRSGSYSFDLECQGAVEAAAASKSWGPLPAQFMDDVLPVIFRFDPKTLR
jgi:periplasmic protein TonB